LSATSSETIFIIIIIILSIVIVLLSGFILRSRYKCKLTRRRPQTDDNARASLVRDQTQESGV
jgi:uncharacterized protein YneF (UPF0154 family)